MAGRTNSRGRPPALLRIAWIQALDSDYRTGRGALPGREWTADLADCQERAVTAGWKTGQDLGWSWRIRVGGPVSEAERAATGRSRMRAEWNLVELRGCDPTLRAPWIPHAVEVAKTVLARAQELLGDAQAALDAERAQDDDGDQGVDWAERVRRIQMRQAVAEVLDRPIVAPGSTILELNTFPPHGVSRGECDSARQLMGLFFSPPKMISSPDGTVSMAFGQGGQDGASRSPTEGVEWCGSPSITRPRTLNRAGRRSQKPRKKPEWSSWAYRLAEELGRLWAPAARPGKDLGEPDPSRPQPRKPD
jgi:hypothetical protein